MARIIRFKQGGIPTFPETIFKAVLSEQEKPLFDYITEYNVSLHHENSVGGNDFTLAEAISTVPDEYRHARLKVTFIDASTGDYSSFVCNDSSYSLETEDWKVSVDDGHVASGDEDGLMSKEDKKKLDDTPDSFTEISDAIIDIITI